MCQKNMYNNRRYFDFERVAQKFRVSVSFLVEDRKMKKNVLLLVSLIVVLSFGSIASAGYLFWCGEAVPGTTTEWSTASNWGLNGWGAPPATSAPTSADTPYVTRTNGPVIHNGDAAVAQLLVIADWGLTGNVSMTGGALNVDSMQMGFGTGSHGIFNMSGGNATVAGWLMVGMGSAANVNLSGGTLLCAAIQCSSLGVVTINPGGKLLIWESAPINGYIQAHNIVAGGNSTLVVAPNGDGYTSITAIPEPATLALLSIGGLLFRRKK